VKTGASSAMTAQAKRATDPASERMASVLRFIGVSGESEAVRKLNITGLNFIPEPLENLHVAVTAAP
jgi:hypothetical protein